MLTSSDSNGCMLVGEVRGSLRRSRKGERKRNPLLSLFIHLNRVPSMSLTLTHSETFTFSQSVAYDDNYGNYYVLTHTPKWPASFPSCTLKGNSVDNKISLEWNGAQPQIYVAAGNMKIVTSNRVTVFELDFVASVFPPAPCGSFAYAHSAGSFWNYQCTVTMSLDLSDPAKPKEYAETFAGKCIFFSRSGRVLICFANVASMVSRIPNDVCIHFPRTGQSLWANETLLRKASPYLSSLLTSGFSETEPTSGDDGTSDEKIMIDPFAFDDSDEESDKVPLSESATQSNDFGSAKFKRIDVTQATYTTYANVLCWIGSGHIAFAPLKSTNRFSSTPGSPKTPPSPSSLPTPASPKSVYRLAHLLELADLADLSLRNFQKQLTTQNVAHELYTDIASTYPQIREIAIDYTVEHWEEVVKSEAYTDVKKRAEAEGIDGLTGILLMEKFAAK